MAIFICPVCLHEEHGTSLPKGFVCPICGTKGWKFRRREQSAASHAPTMVPPTTPTNSKENPIQGGTIMKKFVCPICGYVLEAESIPAGFVCPQCKCPGEKFKEQTMTDAWASEHIVGIASDVPEEIKEGLRANFEGECSEVGMYLAMARVAHREGYPEIGLYWEKAAYEEAEHAAKFAELLGEVITDSTKKNLEMRVEAEYGATAGKTDLAKKAKELGLDAIHDTVHEMARDEARHGKALKGLLERYFK
mgnify:FL=1